VAAAFSYPILLPRLDAGLYCHAMQAAKIQAVVALVALGWDINTTADDANLLVVAAAQGQWRLLT
jgi:hypothetical protein